MATFGAIPSANPNVLFDPAAAMAAAQQHNKNRLLMENARQDQQAQGFERDANARIALARQFADLPDDVLAAEWGPAVQRMQQAGLGAGIPMTPPPRERLKQIAQSDLTTFQKMQLENQRAQIDATNEYRQGLLGVQQARLARTGAPRTGGGGDGVELVPLGGGAPAPAMPSAAAGTTAAAPPVMPQMGEAAPAPEAGGAAARLGGVDVAGPGAPPAAPAAPTGPAPGTRMMVRNGQPITTGLPTGQAWGVDGTGARVVIDIPGVKKMGSDAAPPPIGGNGLDSALLNILVQGDPASPQYAAAFARLGAEEVLPSGLTRRPDMSPFRAPTYRPPGVVEPGAAAIPSGGRDYGKGETGQVPLAAGPSATDRTKLKTAETETAAIISALDAFKERRASSPPGERLGTAAGMSTPLATTYNNAALLAKGEALFNLGVLNGADLSRLQQVIADPSTVRGGLLTSQATVNEQIDEVKKLLNGKLAIARQQYGGQAPAAGAGQPAGERPPLSSFGR